MFDINEYYLGVILAHPTYYNNPKRHRYLGECSFDPFEEVPIAIALTMGVVTLLHKIDDKYFDEYHSIYRNELAYQLNRTNPLGITLAFARPFQDYYDEEPTVYEQEELENDNKKMEEVFNNHNYYIVHNKTNKSYAIVELDTEITKLVTSDYLEEQYKRSGITYQKK